MECCIRYSKRLLPNFSSYVVSVRVFSVIKSFLTRRSLKVITNGQYSELQVINADFPQGSLPGLIIFVFYINDPSKIILRLFLNIYDGDRTIYGSTSKTFLTMANYHSSDLTLAAQCLGWRNDWSYSMTQRPN